MVDALTLLKSFYSICLLLFSIVIIMGLIFTRQTSFAADYHPAMAFCLLWFSLIWLSMVEGGQASLVGLAPVNRALYKESHPVTYQATSIGHKGDNLDRYLLGRQFMVIFIVFVINKSGAPIADAALWGFPDWVIQIFMVTGFAMILLTCMVGQLNTQVNASHCMLDYINDYLNYFTMLVAMAIEASGIVHASYLIQMFVSCVSGRPIESNEEPRRGCRMLFFWLRCIMSLAILVYCFTITLKALFEEKTTMWEGVPKVLSIILFFGLMSVVGMLEGMQIAFFAVAKIREEDRGDSFFAKKTCRLLFAGKGHNLPGFMIGRQLCVVSCFFIIARVTSMRIEEGEENVFGVSDRMQKFFDLGFLGALITTIIASISWQLVASAFPIAFLSNPFTYILLCICLGLERTGICQGAWVLAAIHRAIAGFQRDEVYIGTAEERAAKDLADDESQLSLGAGHMTKLPAFADKAPPALQELIEEDPNVRDFVESKIEEGNK